MCSLTKGAEYGARAQPAGIDYGIYIVFAAARYTHTSQTATGGAPNPAWASVYHVGTYTLCGRGKGSVNSRLAAAFVPLGRPLIRRRRRRLPTSGSGRAEHTHAHTG